MKKKLSIALIVFLSITVYADDSPENKILNVDVATQKMMPQLWFGGDYSDVYGFVAHSQYSNFISDKSAASFLLDYGTNQFRMDLTIVKAFNDNQRVKLSGQHLSQNNEYNFASGDEYTFVGQTAVGAEYEYITQRKFPHAFHLTGYYFSANNSDNLENVTFSNDMGTFVNQRGITGGSGGGVNVGPRLHPWNGAEVKLGFGYDKVHYGMKYEPAKNESGFGVNAYFTQTLSNQLGLEASIENRAPYQQYSAGLTYIPYQNKRTGGQLGIKIEGRHVHSNALLEPNESILGLSLLFKWDGNPVFPNTDRCIDNETSCRLLKWSTESAARLPSVFVQRDQNVTPAS